MLTVAPPLLYLSVVIPVYNEETTLPLLYDRLFPALDALGKSYEVIFVNDGSRDRTQEELEQIFARYSQQVRVVQLQSNAGQHLAVMAGFEQSRGEVVVTIDSDLQNPPEDIARLLQLIEQGHDVVGGYRVKRHDSIWRKYVSRLSNRMRERLTNIRMRDHGCMLRAYRREIVRQMVDSREATPFIPLLSLYFASNPAEIEVGHEERVAGKSKYNLYHLLHLNFDLITSSTVAPLKIFTMVGIACIALSTLLLAWAGVYLLLDIPQSNMTWLLCLLLLLVSITMTGLGLIGEYIGRIYLEVRHRPSYIVKRVMERQPDSGEAAAEPPKTESPAETKPKLLKPKKTPPRPAGKAALK
jgi:undecaprenyl-phosphate 4-deoxy-4-formamido-L-arabinose transferase